VANSNEEWKQELLQRNEITEVIGEYVHLEKKGSRYWAACPWHAERNPSFCVNKEQQFFYCFSCKRGGSVINFIMEQEKRTYPEALQFLAERVGMEMPEYRDDEQYRKKKEYNKRLHAMMRDLALHFHENLMDEKVGRRAREYLHNRKIDNVIKTFGIGYSRDEYDDAYRFLSKKGYTLKEMTDAGVVRSRDGRNYDFFRDRVMFPIQNVYGDVIAFGGRIMGDGDPKYLNSGETVIFNKRYNLYALNTVRKKRDLKNIILTEGYMDVVGLRAVGIDNAVASLGTALTSEQVKLIKKYTDRVYLCYDGDDPGINAALRAIDMLEKENLRVSVMLLPDGMDPDDVAKKYGRSKFVEFAKDSFTGIEFKLKIARKRYDFDNSQDVIDYASEAVAMISRLSNEIEKERYIRQVSEETGYREDSLKRQMDSISEKKGQDRASVQENEVSDELDDEDRLISLLMNRPDILKDDVSYLRGYFRDPVYLRVLEHLQEQKNSGVLPRPGDILAAFPEDSAVLARALGQGISKEISPEEYGDRLLTRILKKRLNERKNAIAFESSKTDKTNEERTDLLKELNDIVRQLRKSEEYYFRG
jgi:DNA primase